MIELLKYLGIFVFVISTVFTLKYLIEFIILMFQKEPKPMILPTIRQILLYSAIAYIITYIIYLLN